MAAVGGADMRADLILPSMVPTSSPTWKFGSSLGADPLVMFQVLKASVAEFPALNSQAVLQYFAGCVNLLC